MFSCWVRDLAHQIFKSCIFLWLQAQQRLLACTELLGEREETILELSADIEDMKVMYREQIELVLGQAGAPTSPSPAVSI